jgi:serine/threonine protein phosphatase PrpC
MEDKAIFSGCVGVLCMIAGDLLITANVGDCRGILSRYFNTDHIFYRNGTAIPLTIDHKPVNEIEKKRILRKGG